MNIFIVFDKNDRASMNVFDKLITKERVFTKTSMRFKEEPVYFYKNTFAIINNTRSADAEKIDDDIETLLSLKPDIIIFSTVHVSRSEIPSFTAHAPGNWGEAQAGGLDRRLCISAESLIKEALKYMNEKEKPDDISSYDIIQEATHHGPSISCPCMFIEIGSTADEWENKNAGVLIADTLIHLIENIEDIIKMRYKGIFGIGGPHSCTNFMKITLNDKRYAISHVCPKHSLELLDVEMIRQAMKRSMNPSEEIVLDWKGMGAEKHRIKQILDEEGINYMKVKEFSYD